MPLNEKDYRGRFTKKLYKTFPNIDLIKEIKIITITFVDSSTKCYFALNLIHKNEDISTL